MSRESGSEHTQRTVAELLAQYGGSPDGAPRRRRRRAADDDQPDTAPQQIIERVLSDSGRMLPIRDEPADQQAPPPPAGGPQRPAPTPPPPPAQAPGTGFQPKPPPPPQVRRPNPAEETRVDPMRPDPGALQSRLGGEAPSRSDIPRPGENSRTNIVRPQVPPSAPLGTPAGPPASDQPSRSDLPRPGENSRTNIVRPQPPAPPAAAPPREAMTEQLPRIPAKAPVDKIASLETESVLIVPPAPPQLPAPLPDQSAEDWFGDDDEPQVAQMEHTAAHPGPYVDDAEDDDYSDNYTPNYTGAREDYLADDEGPAGLSEDDEVSDEDEEREPHSAGKEWLVMIGQLAAGVLGGAALWLAFNYLWRAVPAAALVVALAVTVGLVLLVRKIRRADDLQTTILAVLVGLIVTVSPAAMLLVKS